jgi:hypothetical protein
MRRALKIIVLVIAVVAASILAWRRFLDPNLPVEKITLLIQQEIPKGSTKARVYDFLDARSIPSSGYDVGPDPFYGLPSASRERKRYVTARIPVRGALPIFGDYDIQIVFYFDEDQRLSDYKLQQLYDGP